MAEETGSWVSHFAQLQLSVITHTHQQRQRGKPKLCFLNLKPAKAT